MGKKGVKYYKRGAKKEIKVGFYYFEIILSLLHKNPEGMTIKQIASRLRMNYHTVRNTVNALLKMNRIECEEKKVFNGPPVKHYMKTIWKLN